MSTQTPKLGLNKPEEGDTDWADEINANWDKLDDALTVIDSDTTLYVSTSGSDDTGDGTSGNPWATPQKALDYLKDKWINDDVTVTIQLADGSYNLSTITVEHPCGAQIQIVGQNTHSKNMTSVQSSSGSSGNWSIVINLNNVSSMAVGDYVLIKNASSGTSPEYIEGCHEVTAVDGVNSRITITSKHKASSAPSGAVTAAVTVLKTILNFTSHGVKVEDNNCLGTLNNVALVGNGSNYAVYATTNGHIGCGASVGVSNWWHGFIALYAGSVQAWGCCASGCGSTGFYAAYLAFVGAGSNAVASGCVYGFLVWGGTICGGTSRATGCTNGYFSQHSGAIYAYEAIASGCTNGFQGQSNSSIQANSSTAKNSSKGYYALRYGYIYAASATVSGNTTDYSPSPNTQGNEYGYIDT